MKSLKYISFNGELKNNAKIVHEYLQIFSKFSIMIFSQYCPERLVDTFSKQMGEFSHMAHALCVAGKATFANHLVSCQSIHKSPLVCSFHHISYSLSYIYNYFNSWLRCGGRCEYQTNSTHLFVAPRRCSLKYIQFGIYFYSTCLLM